MSNNDDREMEKYSKEKKGGIETFWLNTVDNDKLYSMTIFESCPLLGIIYFVHGLGDYMQRHEKGFLRIFSENGFRIHGFDLRGHGHNSHHRTGHFDTIQDHVTQDIDNLIKEKDGNLDIPKFLMGCSLGGLCVIWYGLTKMTKRIDSNETIKEKETQNDPNQQSKFNYSLNGILALSPAIKLPIPPNALKVFLGRGLKGIFPKFTVSNDLLTDNISRDPIKVQEYLNDPLVHNKISLSSADSIFSCMEWIEQKQKHIQTIESRRENPNHSKAENNKNKNYENLNSNSNLNSNLSECKTDNLDSMSIPCPLFISHGDADFITDYQASKEFIDKLSCPDKHFASYHGGFHVLHSDTIKDAVIQDYLDWMKKHL